MCHGRGTVKPPPPLSSLKVETLVRYDHGTATTRWSGQQSSPQLLMRRLPLSHHIIISIVISVVISVITTVGNIVTRIGTPVDGTLLSRAAQFSFTVIANIHRAFFLTTARFNTTARGFVIFTTAAVLLWTSKAT